MEDEIKEKHQELFAFIIGVCLIVVFLMIFHIGKIGIFDIPEQHSKLAEFYLKTKLQIYNLKNLYNVAIWMFIVYIGFVFLISFVFMEELIYDIFVFTLIYSFINFIIYVNFVIYPKYMDKKYVSDTKILEEYYKLNNIANNNKKLTLQEMLKTTITKPKQLKN